MMIARHRRTDPVCVKFSGAGSQRYIGRWRVRSLRRWLYDRSRGRSCVICMSRAGFRAYRRVEAELEAAAILEDLRALNVRDSLKWAPGRAD
jgi:hypothetical protein